MIRGMHLTFIGNGSVLLEPGNSLDPSDPDAYFEPLIAYMQNQRATKLIYDLKDKPFIDLTYYEWMVRLNSLCQICNVKMIIANMRPTAAFALAVTAGEEPPPFSCALNVENARELAI